MNVTVIVPQGSPVQVTRGGGSLGLIVLHDNDASLSRVDIDGTNGMIIDDSVRLEYRGVFDNILQTLTVAPIDTTAAPWPYNGEPLLELERERVSNVVLIHPDPAAGFAFQFGVGEGGVGSFYEIMNGRSYFFVQLSTGQVLGAEHIAEEDRPVFQRYVDSIKPCPADAEGC